MPGGSRYKPVVANIVLPQSFLDMPRWQHEGQQWLAMLPQTVGTLCARWGLQIDGMVMHGSNAIVIPVRRGNEPLALRVTPPDGHTESELRAVRFWDGRGVVRLIDGDAAVGASLLERLDGHARLDQRPLAEAVPVIARLMRRLAIPAPPDVPSTMEYVRIQAGTLRESWLRLGRPFSRTILDAAIGAAAELDQTTCSGLAVNGDLHFEQVLRGTREPWLIVDPVLLRGDIEYDLGRIFWSRLDEMADGSEMHHLFDVIVREAQLDRHRAHAWVILRTVEYWLWGLGYGLTADPLRCARLLGEFVPRHAAVPGLARASTSA